MPRLVCLHDVVVFLPQFLNLISNTCLGSVSSPPVKCQVVCGLKFRSKFS